MASNASASLPAAVTVLPHTARGGRSALRKRRAKGTLPAERGVVIVPHMLRGRAVTKGELAQAVAAVRMLPAQDVALCAAHGIKIHLYPAAGLEDGLLGATTVVKDAEDRRWRPTKIRIAARAGLDGHQALGEIVQHEVGHAIAVLRQQDRSEAAAEAYAHRY